MKSAILAALGSMVMALSVSPSVADPLQSERWFLGLTTDQRSDLQGHLVLMSQYGGLVDGEFGNGTYNALIAWQQSVGSAPTGVLDDGQALLLEQMASEVITELGMALVEDPRGHLAIILPKGLLTSQQDRSTGTLYQDVTGEFAVETFWWDGSDGNLEDHFAVASLETSSKSVSYSTLNDERYVVTGLENNFYYYELAYADGIATAGFRFSYSDQFRDIGGVASVFAASYSNPLTGTELAKLAAVNPPTVAPIEPVRVPPSSALPSVAPTTTKKVPNEKEGIREFGNFITMADAPGVVALIGDIEASTPLDFRRALKSIESPHTLVLASDGGLVASALMIAYEVNELGLSTYVMPETQCYSACSFIFLAGKDRLAEGKLGVHQVWGTQTDASSAQTTVSDILEAFGQFGVQQEVTSAMLRTRPEDMYVFDSSELMTWGLNTQ